MRKLYWCFFVCFLSSAFSFPVRVMIARDWRVLTISSNSPFHLRELGNSGLAYPGMQEVSIALLKKAKKLYCLKSVFSSEENARKAELDIKQLGYSVRRDGRELLVKCELEAARKALQERISGWAIASSTYEEELREARFEVKIGDKQIILPPTAWLRLEMDNPTSKEPLLFSVSIDGRRARRYRGSLEVYSINSSISLLVNEVDLEDYLKGVLPGEIPSSFSPESLKAQAVVARTYAFRCLGKHRDEGYDFCNTQHCQVYLGYDYEKEKLNQAIEATRGIIIEYDGRPALTPYHSNCGGISEDANLWGLKLPYLKPKPDCDYSLKPASEQDIKELLQALQNSNCQLAPDFRWTREYTADELAKIFSQSLPTIFKNDCKLGKIMDIRVVERTSSGRAKVMEIQTDQGILSLKGEDIRWAFGNGSIASQGSLPSLLFYIEKKGDTFRIVGGGSGHGIGLCQWGAEGLARKGWTYISIINYYFPSTILRRKESR